MEALKCDSAAAGIAGELVTINVGGQVFTTYLATLRRSARSKLADWFSESNIKHFPRDQNANYFLDRDPTLFGQILNFLRNEPSSLVNSCVFCELNVCEIRRLRLEAQFYGLQELLDCLDKSKTLLTGRHSVITLSYRGTFAFGRDGLADVKFRKLSRILVAGRWSVCREVFRETLNDSRDPDCGPEDRYSSRFFLKHCVLEQAFENLMNAGFTMIGSCGSGTNSSGGVEVKAGHDSEESKWQHYNEFVFARKEC